MNKTQYNDLYNEGEEGYNPFDYEECETQQDEEEEKVMCYRAIKELTKEEVQIQLDRVIRESNTPGFAQWVYDTAPQSIEYYKNLLAQFKK